MSSQIKKCVFVVLYVFLIVLSSTHGQNIRKTLTEAQLKAAKKYLDELNTPDHDNWINPHDMFTSEQVIREKIDKLSRSGNVPSKHVPPKKSAEAGTVHTTIDVPSTSATDVKLQTKTAALNANIKEQLESIPHTEKNLEPIITKKTIKTAQAFPDFDESTKFEKNAPSPADAASRLIKMESNFEEPKITQEPFAELSINECISSDFIFLSRWLKRFIAKVDLFVEPNTDWETTIILPLTEKQLKRLKKILVKSSPNMQDIEEMVVNFLTNMYVDSKLDLTFSRLTTITANELMQIAIILFIAFFVLSIIAWYKHPIKTSFALCAVICVVFEWKHLYSIELVKQTEKLARVDFKTVCKQHELDILGSFSSFIKGLFVDRGSCKEYTEALIIDPIFEVSILKALSSALFKFVLSPIEVIAETANVAVKKLLMDLSFTSFIFVTFFMFLLLMMYCNYRVKMPFFLGSFEPTIPVMPNRTYENIKTLIADELEKKLPIESYNSKYKKLKSEEEKHLCDIFNESLQLTYNPNGDKSKKIKPKATKELLSIKSDEAADSLLIESTCCSKCDHKDIEKELTSADIAVMEACECDVVSTSSEESHDFVLANQEANDLKSTNQNLCSGDSNLISSKTFITSSSDVIKEQCNL